MQRRVSRVSTALVSMSASRRVRAFCAVPPAQALYSSNRVVFSMLGKCLTLVFQFDMELLKRDLGGWFPVCLNLFAASLSTMSTDTLRVPNVVLYMSLVRFASKVSLALSTSVLSSELPPVSNRTVHKLSVTLVG